MITTLEQHREAYERARTRFAAVRVLRPLSTSPTQAAIAVLAALPALVPLRSTFRRMPGFDLVAFDALEELAWANVYLEAQHCILTEPKSLAPLREAVEASTRNLTRLLQVFVDAKRLPPEKLLPRSRGREGMGAAAVRLMATAGVVRREWATIGDRAPITTADLAAAEELGRSLVDAYTARLVPKERRLELLRERQAAFTLLLEDHEAARRAYVYAVGGRPADLARVPPLHQARNILELQKHRRRKKAGAPT